MTAPASQPTPDAASDQSPGALYRLAQQSFADLAATLRPDEWNTPVPCLPGWDVRDVLSHVAGVADDALAGRLDGVATDEWTASQTARNRGFTVEELSARWAAQTAPFAGALDAIDERRPPFDCHSHEHDVRHALGRPGSRDSPIVAVAGAILASGFTHDFPVTIELTDGRVFESPGSDAARSGVTLRDVTPFEVFRSRLGRRTAEQVRAYAWHGAADDIATVVAGWFDFGPADAPIVEP